MSFDSWSCPTLTQLSPPALPCPALFLGHCLAIYEGQDSKFCPFLGASLKILIHWPCLVWLSGLDISLWTERLLV